MHKDKQDACCTPRFKLQQMQEVEVSVLALLPVAPGPSKAQRGRPPPPPLRYWLHQMLAHLETGLKIDSIMSQC